MTREEEIQKSARLYSDEALAKTCAYTDRTYEHRRTLSLFDAVQIEQAFKDGIKWYYKHNKDNTLWISVNDAIPYDYAKGLCLVRFEDGSIGEMAMMKVKFWVYPYIEHGYVTHWKPIPII